MCTGLALANVVLSSRAFGVARSGRDIRNLKEVTVPILAARRVPDVVTAISGDRTLDAQVAELFANERMGSAAQASCVVVRQEGRTLLARNPTTPVIPASTMKLMVASTVLRELDPDSRFITEVRSAAAPTDGSVAGDVFFIGGGDPLLATKPYLATFSRQPQIATSLEQLADDVVAAGVKQINGSIVGHDRRYDDLRRVPTWKANYTTDGEVGPISALSVNDSFVASVTTTKKRATRAVWKGASEPPADAARVLTALLVERGVVVTGEPRSATVSESLPSNVIAQIASPPLSEIVGEMLSESDNNTAESLLKELAFSSTGLGTTAVGAEFMKASFEKRGYPIDQLTFVDGSGLDRSNRVTCAVMVGSIEESISLFRDLLPIAGTSGTLSNRMKGDEIRGKLRAKTGTLNGVSALVGEVDIGGGRTLDFALVLNELTPGVPGVATGDALSIAVSQYPQVSAKSPTLDVAAIEPYPFVTTDLGSPKRLPIADTSTGSDSTVTVSTVTTSTSPADSTTTSVTP